VRVVLLAILLVSATETATVEGWMTQAFYPVLFGVLVLGSLGLPIPEDIPLIAAGVLLNTQPGVATWVWTLFVAYLGIMSGDLVLYTLGRRWGPDVVSHRYVRRLITGRQFERATRRFHRWGMWFCFFGRFFMGIRAVMCMTAGAMRYPYWRFFLADSMGAALSIPLFVYLGYWFGDVLPALRKTMGEVQGVLWGVGAIVAIAMIIAYRMRRARRRRRLGAAAAEGQGTAPAVSQPPVPDHVVAEGTKDERPAQAAQSSPPRVPADVGD
jgi:membrane protein DedA with SNARE-associated domain